MSQSEEILFSMRHGEILQAQGRHCEMHDAFRTQYLTAALAFTTCSDSTRHPLVTTKTAPAHKLPTHHNVSTPRDD